MMNSDTNNGGWLLALKERCFVDRRLQCPIVRRCVGRRPGAGHSSRLYGKDACARAPGCYARWGKQTPSHDLCLQTMTGGSLSLAGTGTRAETGVGYDTAAEDSVLGVYVIPRVTMHFKG